MEGRPASRCTWTTVTPSTCAGNGADRISASRVSAASRAASGSSAGPRTLAWNVMASAVGSSVTKPGPPVPAMNTILSGLSWISVPGDRG